MTNPMPGRSSARAGVLFMAPAEAAGLVADAGERGVLPAVAVLDTGDGKAELIQALATALRFPSWSGRNWDALADALGDLGWLGEGPRLLWIRGLDHLHDDEAGVAVEILARAAQRWAATRSPLLVIIS